MCFNKFDFNLLVVFDVLLIEFNISCVVEKIYLSQFVMSNVLVCLCEYFDDELLIQVGCCMEVMLCVEVLCDVVNDVLWCIEGLIVVKFVFVLVELYWEFCILVFDFSFNVLILCVIVWVYVEGLQICFVLMLQVQDFIWLLDWVEVDLLVLLQEFCMFDYLVEEVFCECYVCVVWCDSLLVKGKLMLECYMEVGYVVMVLFGVNVFLVEVWMVSKLGFVWWVEIISFSFVFCVVLVQGIDCIVIVYGWLVCRLVI